MTSLIPLVSLSFAINLIIFLLSTRTKTDVTGNGEEHGLKPAPVQLFLLFCLHNRLLHKTAVHSKWGTGRDLYASNFVIFGA